MNPLSTKLPAKQLNYLLKQKHQYFPLTLNKTHSLRTYIFDVQNSFENSMALEDPKKRQSTYIHVKMTQTLQLSLNDFKVSTIKMTNCKHS